MEDKKGYLEVCDGHGSTIRLTCDYPDMDVEDYKSWFRTILIFLTFHPKSIDRVLPDCESCYECDDCIYHPDNYDDSETEMDLELSSIIETIDVNKD